MGEDKSGKLEERESRPPLGDVTNQLGGKRGFSLISRSPAKKSKSENNNNTSQVFSDDNSENDSNFWKQVSLVVEKLEKERGCSSVTKKIGTTDVGLSPLKGGKTYRLSDVGSVTKEVSKSALDSIDLDGVNSGDAVKEGCVSVGMKGGEEPREISDVVENEGVGDDRKNQEMRGFGLERCGLLKGGDGLGAGVDLIKHCSCSFCTKAAYIWSDLHYQDVKGRISILAKSQKEASNLVQKYSEEKEVDRHVEGSFDSAAQLETDLRNQWRSLFVHMEDIFGSEGTQLQNNFLALKDLREDFKMNLEMINAMPPDVQQCSSDASDTLV